jgi:hypothetical protein
MAKAKVIDLFGVIQGIEFHIALEPDEDESGVDVLVKSAAYLVSKGAQPRPDPVKGFGGGFGRAKAQEPIPTDCPVCQKALAHRDWSKDGKTFDVVKCPADESHFRKFLLK